MSVRMNLLICNFKSISYKIQMIHIAQPDPGNISLLGKMCIRDSGPTYSEYSRELSFSGSTETWYHLEDSSDFALDIQNLCLTLEKDYDFLIMCNPNNPTSSAVTQEKLRKILTF